MQVSEKSQGGFNTYLETEEEIGDFHIAFFSSKVLVIV